MIVGISQLLPPAKEGQLDSPVTREGMLRGALRSNGDYNMRAIVAKELMQTSLAKKPEFIREIYFGSRSASDETPELRLSILREPGEPPLDATKRKLLADILLDSRFDPMWSEWNLEPHDDVCREFAIRAFHAHAGKELLPDWVLKKKYIPTKEAGLLLEIRQLIETNLAPSSADSMRR